MTRPPPEGGAVLCNSTSSTIAFGRLQVLCYFVHRTDREIIRDFLDCAASAVAARIAGASLDPGGGLVLGYLGILFEVTPLAVCCRIIASAKNRHIASSVARWPMDSNLRIAVTLPALVALVERGVVSFQITILKVLAGQADGRASHPDVTRSVAILMSSGADWSVRMKRLAARAPDLSIFSSNYVTRDDSGWQITDAGRAFLTSIEAPASEPAMQPHRETRGASDQPGDHPSNNVIDLMHHLDKRRGRAAA